MQVLTSTAGQSGLPRYFARVFEQGAALRQGQIDIYLPDGRLFRAGGDSSGIVAEIHIHNPDLFARILREGDLGFSEAYLDGWWSTPDLQSLMDLIHQDNDAMLDGFTGIGLARVYERLRFRLLSNSKRQARRNIAHHYDLGNAFYETWLDGTMTYSSAMFATGQESMEAAQLAKYASLVDEMQVQPGDHILEIGCGWGGFAEYAAKERGLRVTALTISQEQFDFATARMARLGLSDQVEIKLQDYRDETGVYDGIASIEMFEAVGEEYWPTYFRSVRERLHPGRRAALQVITVEDRRFDSYRKRVDFIQKHIFPGGFLPSPSVLRQEIEAAGMRVQRSVEFGASYSETLRRWFAQFNARWDEISGMGFDDRFRRMWNFYLTSCAASFQTGVCDVTQISIQVPTR